MSTDGGYMRHIASRIAQVVNNNIAAFIRKVEGGDMPPDENIAAHGHLVQIKDATGKDWAHFFVWKKHNVLAWRYGMPCDDAAVVFCHLFPDDWPEPLAEHIAQLP